MIERQRLLALAFGSWLLAKERQFWGHEKRLISS